MTFNLKVAEDEDADEWDEMVSNSSQATIFHTWDWLKISEKHSNFSLLPLICYNNTEPIAIYPLFFLKKTGIRMIFSPPPHLGLLYLGPAYTNDQYLKQDKKENYCIETQKIVDQFLQNEINANYISLNLSPNGPDPRAFKWTGYEVEPNYDYIFDLKCGTEFLWENMKKNARAEINRTKKMGVIIKDGNKEELQAIFDHINRRYSDQKRSANISQEYLLEIYSRFKDNIRILTARYDGELITGSIKIRFKNEELSWIGSPKPINFTPSPNSLITWEEMKDAYNNGMDYYIQMGTAGNQRLHKFFTKFNPDLRIRFNVKKRSLSTKIFETAYQKGIKPIYEKHISGKSE